MKFTEMNFFEAEVYNTTEHIKKDKIPLPLKDLVKVEKTGVAIPGKDKYSDKTLEKLADEGINNIIEFERAYEIGNLTRNLNGNGAVLTPNLADDIHNSIENSIANLPGISKKLYKYLASKGIKTISQYKNAHVNNVFNKEELESLGLNMDDVENIQILVERKEKPSLIRVYHSTADINVADYIFKKDWRRGPNSQYYGHGLYTVWTKNSAFDSVDLNGHANAVTKEYYMQHAIDMGKPYCIDESGKPVCFRFEFLIDVKDYYIAHWGLFHQTHPNETYKNSKNEIVPVTEDNFIDYQNKKFGVNINLHRGSVQDYFAGRDYKWNDKRDNPHFVSESKDGKITENGACIKGIAFIGGGDGDIVVVYNTKRALPIRVSKGSKVDWTYIGGPGILTKAENLLSMGITASTEEYWKQVEEAYKKTLDEIFNTHPGSWDMSESEFISSNGKNVRFENSYEDVIEGPESSEASGDAVFGVYEIKNCIVPDSYHIPLREVDVLRIDNDRDANCRLITSLSSDDKLAVNDTIEIYNCPNATLPWVTIYNKDLTGKAKFQNVNLHPGTIIQGFDKAIFEDLTTEKSLGFYDCGGTTNDGKIALVGVKAKNIYIYMDKIDGIKKIKILRGLRDENGDDKIENLHIVTRMPGKHLDQLIIDKYYSNKGFTIHFDIQTDIHQSIYKADDFQVKREYTISELEDILTNYKQEFNEQLRFTINDLIIE